VILEEIGVVCVSNNRSKRYIRELVKNDFIPHHVIVLDDQSSEVLPGQKRKDIGSSFIRLLQDNQISYQVVPTRDVNSPHLIEALKSRPERYYIYSGPGGAILKKDILNIGKKFLHIHPGKLPEFKGSTTIYYHVLSEGKCAASAIFFEKEIDSGPILGSKEYPLPEWGDDIDYDYDPAIRADLLVNVIERYVENGEFHGIAQDPAAGNTYYIMHPVLRHIARLHCESIQSRNS